MRDPNRIPRILAKLTRAWAAAPDWRLGQLVENIQRGHAKCDNEPLFYLKDDRFEAALDKWLKNLPCYVAPKPLDSGPLRGYRANVLTIDEAMLPPP